MRADPTAYQFTMVMLLGFYFLRGFSAHQKKVNLDRYRLWKIVSSIISQQLYQTPAMLDSRKGILSIASAAWLFRSPLDLGKDSIGSNHGVLTDEGVQWLDDDGDSCYFDTSTAHILVQNSPEILVGDRDITVSAWVKFSDTLQPQSIISRDALHINRRSFNLFVWNNRIGFLVGENLNIAWVSSQYVSPNVWIYCLGEYSSNNLIVALEVDGIRNERNVIYRPIAQPLEPLRIGTDGRPGGIPLIDASLRDIFFFQKLLTPQQKHKLRNRQYA